MHYKWLIVTAQRPDRGALNALLAPFNDELDVEAHPEYPDERWNPRGLWDWYLMGGRWTGHFVARKGAEFSIGEPGIMTENAKGLEADQLRKRGIDIEAMGARRRAILAMYWDSGAAQKFGEADGQTREQFIDETVYQLLGAHGFIIAGEIIENRARPGWEPREDWAEIVKDVWQRIPDEHWITVVDMHN